MTTIAPTGSNTYAQAAKSTSQELGQADFLRLMTEQMKNQDPLSPMDNSQFLAQLAQFSTVQGIDDMNSAMSSMASVMESDQTLRAAALVGANAFVESDRFATDGGQPIKGEVVAERAGTVQVDILDAKGEHIARQTVQATGAGPVGWQWDGRDGSGNAVAAGSYQVRATTDAGTDSAALPVRLAARVDSVSIDARGLLLNLEGIGSYSLGAVRRIG